MFYSQKMILTEYFILLGSSLISWKMKKQSYYFLCTSKAKYWTMATSISELLWLLSFLTSFEVFHHKPMNLYYENQATLHIASNLVFYELTKHISIDCHFVPKRLVDCSIVMAHV